jgi:hypothetical protein
MWNVELGTWNNLFLQVSYVDERKVLRALGDTRADDVDLPDPGYGFLKVDNLDVVLCIERPPSARALVANLLLPIRWGDYQV